MKTEIYDLIVVGAGLGGLSAAIFARQNGARVLLLEAGTFGTKHKVCGEFLSPEGGEVLRKLGVTEAVFVVGAREISSARVALSPKKSVVIELPRAGISLSRRALDGVLWRRARETGVETRENFRVSRLDRASELWQVGEDLRAKNIVVATGRGGKLGRAIPSQKPKFLGIKAHFRGLDFSSCEVGLFPFRGGYCGLSRVEGETFNVCALLSYARFGGQSPSQIWDSIRGENAALSHVTRNASALFDWVTTGNVSFGAFSPLEKGVLRCGDAAGYIHPLAGDGMAMALQAGELAARAMETGEDYAALWKAEFGARLSWAARLQPLLLSPVLARVGIEVLGHAPRLGELAARRTRGKLLLDSTRV